MSNPLPQFHLMAKPGGPECNLACDYCFYCEKQALYPQAGRMNHALLEAYVKNYIGSIAENEEVAFTWQGGEPSLLGLDFYQKAIELQACYGKGRNISNSFQTNGLLIDDDWCSFFKQHNFLIGLSLDGPARIHDKYRRTIKGNGSHKLVMRALNLLQKHDVRYNVLACVNHTSSQQPLAVYEFLNQAGVKFVQFIPIVERVTTDAQSGLKLAGPQQAQTAVTDWSVESLEYGKFLTTIFDQWIKRDVGKIFVMNFEWALANFMRVPGAVCHHQPTCGRSLVLEHNGDIYACDHYVYPEYFLGNIQQNSLADMLDNMEQFGRNKFAALPARCRECQVLAACWGGCPKHRFIGSESEPENYLCAGFKHFFQHATPYLQAMRQLMEQGRAVSDIMGATLVYTNNYQS